MKLESKTVHVPALGLDFDVLSDDAVIGPAIANGAWEEHETRLFRSHLRPGDQVVDLGANVGWFAVQGILAGATVHAFEPVPAIAELAQRNIDRAQKIGPGTATLHVAAAGEEQGTARIALGGTNHGDNRVLDADATAPVDMAGPEMLEIAVERVDDLVTGPTRVLKVDTQGSEWAALQGAKRMLEKSPEIAILMEFWPYALRGAKPLELLHFLHQRGFKLGKATEAPYVMAPDRILAQALKRDPVKGGLDLYGVRGLRFQHGGAMAFAKSLWRRIKED